MCGIAGFTKKDPKLLAEFLRAIKHRGPDGEGVHVDSNVSLGMRRLAIIDQKAGNQPIWNGNDTKAIFFNGEIYNYKQIWDQLAQKGYKFKTDHSDTETILLGYEEWGEQVVKHLQGMFAFIIYDTTTKKLFIARDRLGIKPFYYTVTDNTFYFASEIKALLQIPNIKKKVNKEVLYQYLMYRVHDSNEDTFFEGISRLLPGNYMVVDHKGNIEKIVDYWDPVINMSFKGTKPDQDYANELKELYISTIESHLISDVPVGISLSGGLDSTGVASIVRKLIDEKDQSLQTGNKLHTFSAVYPNSTMNELDYIEEALKFVNAEKHLVYPTVDNFWNEIDDWLYTQEEPTISSGPYANYNVMREASKYVKVMLSGQGGDELFAGYIPYFTSYVTSAVNSDNYLSLFREVIKGWDIYLPYFKQILKSSTTKKDSVTMNMLINTSMLNSISAPYKTNDNLNERLFADVTRYSIPNLLRYEDKNSMAFSVEGRVPFLDHKLVEYIFTLPIDLKIKKGWNRYIYRLALKGLIPENIEKRRKKIGFTTPETDWMKQKFDTIYAIFSSDEFKSSNLFSQNVATLYKDWVGGRIQADSMLFWRILNTHLWMKRFNVES